MKQKQNIKIFIVDDQPVFLKVLCGLLNKTGYTSVSLFNSAEECFENLNLYPDIIFLDYHMGEMNGLTLLEKVKEFNPKTVVILTTGTENIQLAMQAIKSGAFDFLLKSNISTSELAVLFNKIDLTAQAAPLPTDPHFLDLGSAPFRLI